MVSMERMMRPPYFELVAERRLASLLQPPLQFLNLDHFLNDLEHMACPPVHYRSSPFP